MDSGTGDAPAARYDKDMRDKKRELPAYFKGRISLDELLASRRLLQLVHRHGPLTQGEASEQLGLSQGACNLHFRRLEHEGLLRSRRLESRGPGRPQHQWELALDRNATLGLVFDPPHLFAQLEDFAGEALLSLEANLKGCRRHRAVESRVVAAVEKAMELVRSKRLYLRSAFAALPGVLDPASGAVRRAVNFEALEGLDVAALLQERFQLPVHANSLGVAYYYGEALEVPPHQTAMVIYWDLGLGFVFGRNRQILTVQGGDELGRAISELGHISIDAQGPRCHCGEAGCLEAYAGGWALLQRFRLSSLEELVSLAATGKPKIRSAIEEVNRLLGVHLAGAIQLLGVTAVRVTGVLSPLFELGQEAFRDGLASVVGAERAAGIQAAASQDARLRLMTGASRAARRAFLYPDEFKRLSRASSTLQGLRMGGE